MANPVIEATELRYRYPDGTLAVDGVSIRVDRGERVAIVGANGSGKSTLLLLLGGLLAPEHGSVRYFGESTNSEAHRSRIGVLMQDPDDFLFNPTVRDDIEYGPSQLGVSPAETDRIVADLADSLDLAHLLEKPPFRLSGGEKKRAALACVLAFEPDVLLLDEPNSNVDASHAATLLEALAERTDDRNVALVTATPDIDFVPKIADRVCLLDRERRLVADDAVRAVLSDGDLLREHGLAPPKVVQLLTDLGVDDPPLTVDGAREVLESELLDDRP